MLRESTSGGGSCNGDVKIQGEAGVNGEAGAHRCAATNGEVNVK